jgi:hypothetical protein
MHCLDVTVAGEDQRVRGFGAQTGRNRDFAKIFAGIIKIIFSRFNSLATHLQLTRISLASHAHLTRPKQAKRPQQQAIASDSSSSSDQSAQRPRAAAAAAANSQQPTANSSSWRWWGETARF